MKKNFLLSLFFSIISLSSEAIDLFSFTPYLGLGYAYSGTEGNQDWSKVLEKNMHLVRGYTGVKFHQNFGLEFSIAETMFKRQKDSFFNANSTVFGGRPGAGKLTTKYRVNAFELSLFGFVPTPYEYLSAIGSIGYAWTKVDFSAIASSSTEFYKAFLRAADSRKLAARLTLGLEYALAYVHPNTAVRISVSWDNTRCYRIKNVNAGGFNIPVVAFRNTVGLNLGAHYYFG